MADALEGWLDGFPDGAGIPFRLRPAGLYGVTDLYDSYDPGVPGSWDGTYDHRAFAWFIDAATGKPRKLTLSEAIAARVHDAFIETAIDAFLSSASRKAVGIMGGYDISRGAPAFLQVAAMARTLKRAGLQVVSGGGPGLMEAANLGAFLAPFEDGALDEALGTLAGHDFVRTDPSPWIASACAVRGRLLGGDWRAAAPAGSRSLGIPTWHYGAEPPNLFATHIGKYFYNSVREDGLVTVASGGLVFAPGAAGTVQEIFQDATRNYYAGEAVRPTPMVFLGRDFWDPGAFDPVAMAPGAHPKPVYPLVEKLARDASPPFCDYLLLSDDAAEIVAFLERCDAEDDARPRLAEVRLARVC